MPVSQTILRHFDVARQRRAAESPQVERHDDVLVGKLGRYRARRVELDAVTLAIIHRKRGHGKARLAR